MAGITLSTEQLRAAPADVRRWIEHEVAVTLGLHVPEVVDAKRGSPQLAGLTVDEAAKVLSLIKGTLPVVNVFFELGREAGSPGVNDLETFRLVDITHHARLQTMARLADCPNIINAAVRSVRSDANATLYGVDQRVLLRCRADPSEHSAYMARDRHGARLLDLGSPATRRLDIHCRASCGYNCRNPADHSNRISPRAAPIVFPAGSRTA